MRSIINTNHIHTKKAFWIEVQDAFLVQGDGFGVSILI